MTCSLPVLIITYKHELFLLTEIVSWRIYLWRWRHGKYLTQCDESCVFAFDILLICSDYRSKQNLHIVQKFGCLHATYSLSVLYLSSKH